MQYHWPTHHQLTERIDEGRAARKVATRSSHADWTPSPTRRDPVALIEEQNRTRVDWLVPVRHGRMSVNPFTFYRGAARVMAEDLSFTPTSGLTAQLGGDAHLSNFGAYGSPERRLVFDANDFDETLPGPFEWDVKRLAASLVIAAQHLAMTDKHAVEIAVRCVEAYRTGMTYFSQMNRLPLWYDHLEVGHLAAVDSLMTTPQARERLAQFEERAHNRDSTQALRKLTVEVDGRYRIRSDPPVLFPLDELPVHFDPEAISHATRIVFGRYKETLADDRRFLLDGYTPVDVGVKVVGVGSVGTRCFIVLLEGRDRSDPLFLQIKEAGPSVLEEHLGASAYDNAGRRVVEGQRLTQAVSDIFLGWTTDLEGRHYYVRQLRDWKNSFEVEHATADGLKLYGQLCGWTLARGHARSGDRVAIAAYLGRSDVFDKAIAEFALRYSRQNLSDFGRFTQAIADGHLPCQKGV